MREKGTGSLRSRTIGAIHIHVLALIAARKNPRRLFQQLYEELVIQFHLVYEHVEQNIENAIGVKME